MNIEELVVSASLLKQPMVDAAGEFAQKRDGLADALNRQLLAREDLLRLIGAGNQAMMEDNSRNFCRFMSSLFEAYEPAVMVRTVLWVFRAYRSHGFQLTFWPAELDEFVAIMRQDLSAETFEALYPFFNWMIVNIPAFVQLTDEQLPDLGTPHHE